MTENPRWKSFDHIDCWIFDLDNTLYPSKSNLFAKIDKKMGEFISDFLKVDLIEAKNVQKKYFHEHGTTLSGLMQNYDINPADFLDYVHDIDVSDLLAAPELSDALEQLPGTKLSSPTDRTITQPTYQPNSGSIIILIISSISLPLISNPNRISLCMRNWYGNLILIPKKLFFSRIWPSIWRPRMKWE